MLRCGPSSWGLRSNPLTLPPILAVCGYELHVMNCKNLGPSYGRKGLIILQCSIAPPWLVKNASCNVVALWKCKPIKWMCVGRPTARSKPTAALMYMHPSWLHGLLE